ncbi:MAG TPA: nuclear transport factor 2 family protein [Steroidobacteraceae bacterium]|nr:nuclear transport factor 2 family protein [Steroidobacteraceae bacterium]
MRRFSIVLAAAALTAPLLVGSARADSTADLIELDRQWGAAGTKGDVDAVAKLLADDLVSVDAERVGGKKEELAAVKPEPAGTQYEPTDYKVSFLGDDLAIMTHGTKGKDAHHSLHVWSRIKGQWKVVATSSTPVKTE